VITLINDDDIQGVRGGEVRVRGQRVLIVGTVSDSHAGSLYMMMLLMIINMYMYIYMYTYIYLYIYIYIYIYITVN
jgi:hypothetical protein